MKKTTTLAILLLLCFSQKGLLSQQRVIPPVEKDSISIRELIHLVEANSDYRIYTNLEQTLKIPAAREEAFPLQMLRNSFKNTEYMVSKYGNNIFILTGGLLDTRYTLVLNQKQTIGDTLSTKGGTDLENPNTYFEKAEKAISENKIYVIGNERSKEKKSKAVLKGKVTAFTTGEPIPGINISLENPPVNCSTDIDGNYSIELPTGGRLRLNMSGFSVKPSSRQLILYEDGYLDIQLLEDVQMLNAVTVYANRLNQIKNTEIGVEKIEIAKIKNIPMALGEVDLLKALQTLPGVKTVGEASTGFNVRGGATDQNLILLNNGTIYNPNHLFGFFTAFSTEMIQDAELFKSNIPAKYGGRISSVLNITCKEAIKE